MLNKLAEESYKAAKKNGYYPLSEKKFVNHLASELLELQRALAILPRVEKDTWETEAIDLVLIVFSYLAYKKVDVEKVLKDKLNYNKVRQDYDVWRELILEEKI